MERDKIIEELVLEAKDLSSECSRAQSEDRTEDYWYYKGKRMGVKLALDLLGE